MSAKLTNFLDYKRRRSQGAAVMVHACLKTEPPALPSVMARIGSRDQFMSVEIDVSAFLATADNVAICALLSGIDSWAAAELVQWASESRAGVRHLLEYIDVTRDTEYETDYEVRLTEAQTHCGVQMHRPVLAAELTGSPTKLAKMRMAKAVLDSGWGKIRTQLQYKGQWAGRSVRIVNEASTTRACFSCSSATGPSGLRQLVVRRWRYSE